MKQDNQEVGLIEMFSNWDEWRPLKNRYFAQKLTEDIERNHPEE